MFIDRVGAQTNRKHGKNRAYLTFNYGRRNRFDGPQPVDVYLKNELLDNRLVVVHEAGCEYRRLSSAYDNGLHLVQHQPSLDLLGGVR